MPAVPILLSSIWQIRTVGYGVNRSENIISENVSTTLQWAIKTHYYIDKLVCKRSKLIIKN